MPTIIPTLVEAVDAPSSIPANVWHAGAEQTLKALRLRRQYSQLHVSQAMQTSQGEVSRIEKRKDLHLATLRSYIRALGGELVLLAKFTDEQNQEVIRIAI